MIEMFQNYCQAIIFKIILSDIYIIASHRKDDELTQGLSMYLVEAD